jgi:membrane protein DedA with SNARE-associated domain
MNLESIIDGYGYYAVFLGSVLEGETILALGGYAAHRGYLALPWVIAIGAAGGFLGDQIYFGLGRWMGPSFLKRFPRTARQLPRLDRVAQRYPALVVILLRFMYGLRAVGPIALGAGRMPIGKFAALNAVGALLWAIVIAGAGYALGHSLELILADARKIEEAVFLAIMVAGVVAWIILRPRR